jgi:hypothetical protein
LRRIAPRSISDYHALRRIAPRTISDYHALRRIAPRSISDYHALRRIAPRTISDYHALRRIAPRTILLILFINCDIYTHICRRMGLASLFGVVVRRVLLVELFVL